MDICSLKNVTENKRFEERSRRASPRSDETVPNTKEEIGNADLGLLQVTL